MFKIKNRKLKLSIENIKDPDMKKCFYNFIIKFIETAVSEVSIRQRSKLYASLGNSLKLISLSKFNWEQICNIIKQDNSLAMSMRNFLTYLVKENLYVGDYKEELSELLISLNGVVQVETLLTIFNYKYTPACFYIEKNSFSPRRTAVKIFNLNTSNIFLRTLLIEFIDSSPKTTYKYREFFYYFEASLQDITVNTIYDFNINTFDTQFSYYKNNNLSKYLSPLCSFYLMILNKDNNIITLKDGFDINTIQRADFHSLYSDGFRVVLFNPNDPIPQSDKWILYLNGYEIYTTIYKSKDYKKIDFTIISNDIFRSYAKKWFWETTSSISTKAPKLLRIASFCNFLDNLKNKNILPMQNQPKNTITTSEIYAYKTNLNSQFNNSKTQAHYIDSVKVLLTFLKENKLINIETGAFYYLSVNYSSNNYNPVSIPPEHLTLIEKKLKEESYNSYLKTLYYIAFHISLNTEFRISQIFNLEVNCVQPAMKENQYVLISNTKVTNGDKKEQPISIYTKRHIDELISFTTNIRNNCNDPLLNKYLFLYLGDRNIYRVARAKSFYSHIIKCCEALGLPSYSATNLRKTYITYADELKLKNQWSELDLKSITNHAHKSTIDKHYIDLKIRNILQSTYGVIIGDVNINGKVSKETTIVQTAENTVDEGCGICSNSSCNVNSNLDCPMCPNFIVTVNMIPYYKEKLDKINSLLNKVTIQHEKEHLNSIKRLYLAYLEKLYLLKDGVN